jgi:hypothetical protein
VAGSRNGEQGAQMAQGMVPGGGVVVEKIGSVMGLIQIQIVQRKWV